MGRRGTSLIARRAGDNLYLSSIVAVRPKTGQYVWHFQETPGETWDLPPPSTSFWPI
jgi:glucose dehydrogenase